MTKITFLSRILSITALALVYCSVSAQEQKLIGTWVTHIASSGIQHEMTYTFYENKLYIAKMTESTFKSSMSWSGKWSLNSTGKFSQTFDDAQDDRVVAVAQIKWGSDNNRFMLTIEKHPDPNSIGQTLSYVRQEFNCLDCPVMIAVKGGSFVMGGDWGDEEMPLHTVTVSDFYIGKYEITNAQYAEFLNESGNKFENNEYWIDLDGKAFYGIPPVKYDEKCRIVLRGSKYYVETGYEQHPVIFVSWSGAKAYCDWLSNKTGKKYSLATEAEWEYAARGGTKSKGYTYSGSNSIEAVAWKEYSQNKCRKIGNKIPNELGIYDMSGNVWEWCLDWYDTEYYRVSPAKNPNGPSTGYDHVVRGGGGNEIMGRVAQRYTICCYGFSGFRITRHD